MPIDFPANPTNGQVYSNWIYDSSIGAWRNVNTDTGVAALNTMGLRNVAPTSVSVGSGSATTNANGTVSFSGATSVSLNGVFNSTYTNYRLMLNFSAFTANHNMGLRFRTSGVDASGANYFYAGNTMSTASGSGGWVENGASRFNLGTNASIYGNRARHFIELWDPAIATNTKTFWNSFFDNGTAWINTTVSGTHLVSTA